MNENLVMLPRPCSTDSEKRESSPAGNVLPFRDIPRIVKRPSRSFRITMGEPFSQRDVVDLCGRIRRLFERGDSIADVEDFIGPILTAIFEGYQRDYNLDLYELVQRIAAGKLVRRSEAPGTGSQPSDQSFS